MKTDKIIIYNKSDLDIIAAMDLVKEVIKIGRISNMSKQFSYVTTFSVMNRDYFVHSYINDLSDKFEIYGG